MLYNELADPPVRIPLFLVLYLLLTNLPDSPASCTQKKEKNLQTDSGKKL